MPDKAGPAGMFLVLASFREEFHVDAELKEYTVYVLYVLCSLTLGD